MSRPYSDPAARPNRSTTLRSGRVQRHGQGRRWLSALERVRPPPVRQELTAHQAATTRIPPRPSGSVTASSVAETRPFSK